MLLAFAALRTHWGVPGLFLLEQKRSADVVLQVAAGC